MKLLDLIQQLYIMRGDTGFGNKLKKKKKWSSWSSTVNICLFSKLKYYKDNISVPSRYSSSMSGSLMTFSFRLFSSFLNSRLMLSISVLRRGDGSIRITFGSMTFFNFL